MHIRAHISMNYSISSTWIGGTFTSKRKEVINQQTNFNWFTLATFDVVPSAFNFYLSNFYDSTAVARSK